MPYEIRKKFRFSAAHRLAHLGPEHPCARVHGHNYEVEVVLAGGLDAEGMVFDYRGLARVKAWVDETLDHRDLSEVLAPLPATAENLAAWVFARWRRDLDLLAAVRISETPDTWAEYRP